MLRTLALVVCLASEAFAWSMYHRFENIAIFSIPFNASILQPHLHPAVKIDQDKNGVAWLSILSAQLVNVPFMKPLEIQALTYVTGPDPVSKQPVKGSMVLDVVTDKSLAVAVASRLVPPGTRVSKGQGMEISTSGTSGGSYTLKGSTLPVESDIKDLYASVYASSVIKDTPVEFDSYFFFLDRSAWFGKTEKGELAVSMLRGNTFTTPPRQMQVDQLSSDVFSILRLGPNMTQDICKQHKESCFFVARQEVTIESPVVVAGSASPHSASSSWLNQRVLV